MSRTWTNNPATIATHIRSVHVNELRSAVDQDRTAANMAGYNWSDNPAGTGTHVRSVHFLELRTAIQDLWTVKRMGWLPWWSVGSQPSPQREISARDINDLRDWTDQYEASTNTIDPQGIVSFSYNPNEQGGTSINGAWCDDLTALKPNGQRLLVRTLISASNQDNSLNTGAYQSAISTWTSKGFSVAGVLAHEFDQAASCPNGQLGLDGNPLLNDYINDFSLRAEDFASNMVGSGLPAYWVWNEPNLRQVSSGDNCSPMTDTSLAPENFAAILYQGCTRLRAGGATTVYAGGLSVLVNLTDPNGPLCKGYLENMYQYLKTSGIVAPFPWNALSLNMELYPDETFIASVVSAIQSVQKDFGDASPLIVSEWGNANDVDTTRAPTTYSALRKYFDTMYFYAHPQDLSNNYGARAWTASGGQYGLGATLSWYGELQSLYQSP